MGQTVGKSYIEKKEQSFRANYPNRIIIKIMDDEIMLSEFCEKWLKYPSLKDSLGTIIF